MAEVTGDWALRGAHLPYPVPTPALVAASTAIFPQPVLTSDGTALPGLTGKGNTLIELQRMQQERARLKALGGKAGGKAGEGGAGGKGGDGSSGAGGGDKADKDKVRALGSRREMRGRVRVRWPVRASTAALTRACLKTELTLPSSALLDAPSALAAPPRHCPLHGHQLLTRHA